MRSNNQQENKALTPMQKQAVLVCIVCALAALLTIGITLTMLKRGKNPTEQPGDSSIITPAPAPEGEEDISDHYQINETSSALLTGTADAGDAYQEQTLFIGDSNTVRLYANGLISLQQFCAKEGIGTSAALNEGIVTFKRDDNRYTIAQAVAKMKPRRVVIMLGTNDNGMNTEDFISNYTALVQAIQASDTAGVNEEELADLSRDIVHVVGRLNEDSFRPLQTAGLQGNSLSYRNSRIEELKEISGNRDLTQGGTTGGVTAASAIAALQEAGSKLSRDMLKSAYRAFARQCYLIIELMRQFYDEQRVFRITGQHGESEFVPFSAQGLRAKPVPAVGGVELGSREPVFDIVVSAAKKSTFSRLSQNETAKECYKLGFFDPANADAALAALEMMDFEGVEKVRARVRQNGTLAQQLVQLQGQMARLSAALAQQPGGTQAAQDAAGLTAQLPVAAAARAMNWNGKEVK